jgi:hypothetical protein
MLDSVPALEATRRSNDGVRIPNVALPSADGAPSRDADLRQDDEAYQDEQPAQTCN